MADTPLAVILHGFPRAPSAQRVQIALALKRVDYERRDLDLVTGGHRSAEFAGLNPQAFVPVLEIDGLRLCQSLAIIAYLDETRAAPLLRPSAPAARAMADQVALDIATAAGPLTNLSVLTDVERRFGTYARREWLIRQLCESLDQMDRYLGASADLRFACGADPAVADCVLAPHIHSAWRWGIDIATFPRLNTLYSTYLNHPDFAATLNGDAV